MICIDCKKPPGECQCKGFKKWAGKDKAMTDAKKPDPIRAAAEEIINCGFVTPAKEFEEQICSIIRREVDREREKCWIWAHEHTIGRVTDEELLKYIRQGGK